MNKKMVIRYILMYIPMVLGLVLFCFGIVNIVSSLLLFLGGYYAVKNTLDYRIVKKNIDKSKIVGDKKQDYACIKNDKNISSFKRVKRKIRVKKREKD